MSLFLHGCRRISLREIQDLSHRTVDGIMKDVDWTELERSDPSDGDEGDES